MESLKVSVKRLIGFVGGVVSAVIGGIFAFFNTWGAGRRDSAGGGFDGGVPQAAGCGAETVRGGADEPDYSANRHRHRGIRRHRRRILQMGGWVSEHGRLFQTGRFHRAGLRPSERGRGGPVRRAYAAKAAARAASWRKESRLAPAFAEQFRWSRAVTRCSSWSGWSRPTVARFADQFLWNGANRIGGYAGRRREFEAVLA